MVEEMVREAVVASPPVEEGAEPLPLGGVELQEEVVQQADYPLAFLLAVEDHVIVPFALWP